ncbi:unnamed protein product [Peronospora destructor]|uniref:Pre-mRNA polyadenylation factor Fip1 domain-containing protein n=1 Tax=Peronospora destructor TaxID=86335 RepID=A0AAV0V9U0_9STRA|nr:unnamed protein product [Peronospora destructor]
MEDEDFGEDVLVTSRTDDNSVKEEAKTEESRTTWEAANSDRIKPEKMKNEQEQDEDEDEELYGGVSIQLNASATSVAAAEAAAKNVPIVRLSEEVSVVGSEDDEDEEDVAIVLSKDHAGNKPTLRFTGGGNRYVRGNFGSSQQGWTGNSGDGVTVSSQSGDTDPLVTGGVDDMALFGGRRTAFDVDIDLLEDRPWRKPGVDISDYFNYGFDEHSWREYASRQLRVRRDLAVEKSREQASRQAVNTANQQAMRDRDANMQGGGGIPPRGFPGQTKLEGGDDQNAGNRSRQWGAGVIPPPMSGGPPRGAPGFLGGPQPRGWHPGMGPPLGFGDQQNWNGPPMGAPWNSGPGRGLPWMGGPGGGRGRSGGRDDRGRNGKDDKDDRRGDRSEASRDRSRSRDRLRRDDSRGGGHRDEVGAKGASEKDRGRGEDRDRGRGRDRASSREKGRERDRRDRRPREQEGRGSEAGDPEKKERGERNRADRGGRLRSRDRDSRKRKDRDESAGAKRGPGDQRSKRRR